MSTSSSTSEFSTSLNISNQFEDLMRVSVWLEHMAQRYQLAEPTVFKLDLVLNEALPNIISYAFDDDLRHDIVIKLEDHSDQVFLEIIDDGLPFDPFNPAPLPPGLHSLESASINGRGIHLITSYTDAQEYQYVNNLNIMRVAIDKASVLNKRSAENIS
ncbi:MAG: ATP-binding protein [Methylobacter sp.]|nr:ATP-binding protein [Methylobacter sp.]